MTWNLVFDALLIVGFGVQHSVIATLKVKTRIASRTGIQPLTLRATQSFINVAYIFAAIAVWRPVDSVVWSLHGPAAIALGVMCAVSWLWYFQLHIFEYDAGLAFGSTAVLNRIARRKGPRMEMWKVGTRRWIRFPVHTAFFPMFLAFPHMIASTLVLGVVINIYNVIGSILYDKRLEKLGKPYRVYQDVTGLLFPRIGHLQGASEIDMARPHQWQAPTQYIISLAIGLVGGAGYVWLLGFGGASTGDVAVSALVGVGLAVGAGLLIGVLPKGRVGVDPRAVTYSELQTRLGTSAAIISATSLITWFSVTWVTRGQLPSAALVLPLWLIVLWLGHVASYLFGYRTLTLPDEPGGSSTEPARMLSLPHAPPQAVPVGAQVRR